MNLLRLLVNSNCKLCLCFHDYNLNKKTAREKTSPKNISFDNKNKILSTMNLLHWHILWNCTYVIFNNIYILQGYPNIWLNVNDEKNIVIREYNTIFTFPYRQVKAILLLCACLRKQQMCDRQAAGTFFCLFLYQCEATN